MENKIATTIEQSKKLIELGLSVDTADMNYCNASYKGKNYIGEWKLSLQSPQEAKSILDISATDWNTYWEIIPAWSLSALMNLMPKGFVLVKDSVTENYHLFSKGCMGKSTSAETPIDAVFEMVCYLKENRLI